MSVSHARHLLLTLTGICLFTASPLEGGAPFTVSVSAGKHDRQGTLIEVPLAATPGVQQGRGSLVLRLTREDDKGSVVAQCAVDTLVFRLEEPLAAGESRAYRSAGSVSGAGARERIRCEHAPGRSITVRRGDRPVLVYNTGTVRCPDREHRAYDRTGYVHPVWTPEGKIITDDFPSDERHQRGLFLAWRKFEWGDRVSDFWSLKGQDASMRHESVERVVSGPVYGEFVVHNKGIITDARSGEEHHVLEERWRVRAYEIGRAGYLYDIHIRHLAIGKDLKVSKMNWGGLAYRGPAVWFQSAPEVLTSEGKDRLGGDGQPARWCRYGGLLDGQPVSITIFDHPSNPRYPKQLLRIHPTRPYFCFPVSRSGAFTITTRKALDLRYRVYVTDRLCESEELETMARDFVDPPGVTVK